MGNGERGNEGEWRRRRKDDLGEKRGLMWRKGGGRCGRRCRERECSGVEREKERRFGGKRREMWEEVESSGKWRETE